MTREIHDDVYGDMSALECVVESICLYPPTYTSEYVEYMAELSDKLAERVIILKDYKERKAA